MQTAPSVSFHDLPSSPALEEHVLGSVRRLERFYGRITSCRVVLSASHHHRRGEIVSVRIHLAVPGEEIVVDHDAGLDASHANVRVAIRDAFKAARRRLQDHVRRVRGDVKRHATGGLDTGRAPPRRRDGSSAESG